MSEELAEQQQPEERQSPEGFIDKARWVEMGRDPDEWRDPDEFAERGEKITGVLKKQRDDLMAEMKALKDDTKQHIDHMRSTVERREQEAYEKAKREHDQQLAAIRAEKKRAVEEGDGDALIRAEEAQDSLRPPQQPQAHQAPPQMPPEFVEWQGRNDWYANDPKLRRYADAMSMELGPKVQAGQMSFQQALQEVEKEVKTEFAHKFGNQARNQPPAVGDGGAPPAKRGKSYRDLPADAKQACDKFVRKGIMTKEQYIKDYFGE